MARHLLAGSLVAIALAVTGCGGDDTADPEATTTSTTTSTTSTTSPSSASTSSSEVSTSETSGTTQAQPSPTGAVNEAGEGCWVHLFEEDDFDESDDNHRLTEPGRFADLDDLPGATDDWTDEAESIRVGPEATVTIWPDTDFRGQPVELAPGSEHPDIDDEPESLELTC